MLLLNINRKTYMGIPMAPSYLTLSDLERSQSIFTNVLILRTSVYCTYVCHRHLILIGMSHKVVVG